MQALGWSLRYIYSISILAQALPTICGPVAESPALVRSVPSMLSLEGSKGGGKVKGSGKGHEGKGSGKDKDKSKGKTRKGNAEDRSRQLNFG